MSIPQIEHYQLNSTEFSVTNIVNWTQQNERSILLIHDMQNYFVKFFPEKLQHDLVKNCRQLLDHARSNGIPVVYTAQRGDMSREERGLLLDFWGKGMSSKPDQTRIFDELAPQSGDMVLAKWRYSAFHDTGLDEIISQSGRDQMLICGVFAHIGVLTSAIDAYSRDIQVFLVQDAIADFTKQDHIHTLKHAAKCCSKVVKTVEVCQ